MRERGVPLCSSSGLPSRITSQPPITQSAFCVPDPHCQRPLTRKPPASATALPRGANTPPSSTSAGEDRARGLGRQHREHGARRRADEHAPAAEPSACASVSIVYIVSAGGSSSPPYTAGTHIR
jgi:hypothetical protein